MRAIPATNFPQRDPDNGQPATEQTEVRFVYDADKLYMGVTLFDSGPDRLIHYEMGRDGFLPSDDKLRWAFDTSNDGQSAYWWEMNPLGSMADALRGPNNTSNREWDGIWDARSTRSDIGWIIEIELYPAAKPASLDSPVRFRSTNELVPRRVLLGQPVATRYDCQCSSRARTDVDLHE